MRVTENETEYPKQRHHDPFGGGGGIRRKPRYRYSGGLNRPEKSPSQPDQESNEEQDDGGGEKTRDGLQCPQGEVPKRREQEVPQGPSPGGSVGEPAQREAEPDLRKHQSCDPCERGSEVLQTLPDLLVIEQLESAQLPRADVSHRAGLEPPEENQP